MFISLDELRLLNSILNHVERLAEQRSLLLTLSLSPLVNSPLTPSAATLWPTPPTASPYF